MLVAPEDLSTEEVLRVVQEHWDPKVRSGALFPQGSGAPHWVCGGARHPRWFVTADDVTAPGRLAEREAAYAAARRLAHKGLHFVVPTVAPVGGGIGVRHGRHLVTVTAYHEGESGPGPYADDNQRALVAHEIGLLHATRPPRRAPVWKPGLASRSELVQLLETVDDTQWDTGPFGESVRTALRDNRPRLLRLFARFDVLAAQALASRKTWVVTHGEPHTANVLWRLGGPVLLDWESLRLAPRERDLRVVLRDAESAEPLSAYVASGGTVDLDADMVELFDLELGLTGTARSAVWFSRPHVGNADEARLHEAFLDEVVPAVADGLDGPPDLPGRPRTDCDGADARPVR